MSGDMREWEPPEKADILVSELLGSFGDNELSPECLDGAQKFLKGLAASSDDWPFLGWISILCKYRLLTILLTLKNVLLKQRFLTRLFLDSVFTAYVQTTASAYLAVTRLRWHRCSLLSCTMKSAAVERRTNIFWLISRLLTSSTSTTSERSPLLRSCSPSHILIAVWFGV